jgi:hypothetical protein
MRWTRDARGFSGGLVTLLIGAGIVAAVACAAPAAAGTLTVVELLDAPSKYDGEAITISGQLGNVRSFRLKRNVFLYTFDLTSGAKFVTVTAPSIPACAPGMVLVAGRVHVKQRSSGQIVRIDADRIECP